MLASLQELVRSQHALITEQHTYYQEQIAMLTKGRSNGEAVGEAHRAPGREVATFRKLGPPVYKGSDEPEDIHHFLRVLEKIFMVM